MSATFAQLAGENAELRRQLAERDAQLEALAGMVARLHQTLDDPTLDAGPKLVETFRLAHAAMYGGADEITVDQLARVTGKSVRQTQRYRAQLEDLGRVEVKQQPGKANRYRPATVRPVKPQDWRRRMDPALTPDAAKERRWRRLSREAERARWRGPQARHAVVYEPNPAAPAETREHAAQRGARRAPFGAAAVLTRRARQRAHERRRQQATNAPPKPLPAEVPALRTGGDTDDAPPTFTPHAREEAPLTGGGRQSAGRPPADTDEGAGIRPAPAGWRRQLSPAARALIDGSPPERQPVTTRGASASADAGEPEHTPPTEGERRA